jgi:hypothetical protein
MKVGNMTKKNNWILFEECFIRNRNLFDRYPVRLLKKEISLQELQEFMVAIILCLQP